MKLTAAIASLAALLGLQAPAAAQELRLGMAAEATSADPHFYNFSPNNGLVRHIYEALVLVGKDDTFHPGLAESWHAVDDRTWEFKLRPGVKWHDGSPFSADDVVFTFTRARNVPRSPNSFITYIGTRTVTKVDDLTVRFHSETPDPLLVPNLSQVMLVSARHGQGATTDDYNSGKAAIGTGAFKLVEFKPGERVVLARNDEYWGPKPDWARVTFKPIRNDGARVSALLANDVDVIDTVPTGDLARLRADKAVAVSSVLGSRMMYLHLDRHRASSPWLTAKDNKPIPNPLNDLRVRQAMSMAINRQAIIDRLLEHEAEPAGQFLTARYPGASKKLKPMPFDPERSRALLKAAGFPDGFKLTLHGPNGRYPHDGKVLEAIAQMFTRVGIETQLDLIAPASYFTRASSGGPGGVPEFSVLLAGGGSNTAEPSSALIPLILTLDRARGLGGANRGRYSNPRVDELTLQGAATMDDAKRNALLAEAMEIAFDDVAMIPLYFDNNIWATRRPIAIEARVDEFTLAMGIKAR